MNIHPEMKSTNILQQAERFFAAEIEKIKKDEKFKKLIEDVESTNKFLAEAESSPALIIQLYLLALHRPQLLNKIIPLLHAEAVSWQDQTPSADFEQIPHTDQTPSIAARRIALIKQHLEPKPQSALIAMIALHRIASDNRNSEILSLIKPVFLQLLKLQSVPAHLVSYVREILAEINVILKAEITEKIILEALKFISRKSSLPLEEDIDDEPGEYEMLLNELAAGETAFARKYLATAKKKLHGPQDLMEKSEDDDDNTKLDVIILLCQIVFARPRSALGIVPILCELAVFSDSRSENYHPKVQLACVVALSLIAAKSPSREVYQLIQSTFEQIVQIEEPNTPLHLHATAALREIRANIASLATEDPTLSGYPFFSETSATATSTSSSSSISSTPVSEVKGDRAIDIKSSAPFPIGDWQEDSLARRLLESDQKQPPIHRHAAAASQEIDPSIALTSTEHPTLSESSSSSETSGIITPSNSMPNSSSSSSASEAKEAGTFDLQELATLSRRDREEDSLARHLLESDQKQQPSNTFISSGANPLLAFTSRGEAKETDRKQAADLLLDDDAEYNPSMQERRADNKRFPTLSSSQSSSSASNYSASSRISSSSSSNSSHTFSSSSSQQKTDRLIKQMHFLGLFGRSKGNSSHSEYTQQHIPTAAVNNKNTGEAKKLPKALQPSQQQKDKQPKSKTEPPDRNTGRKSGL